MSDCCSSTSTCSSGCSSSADVTITEFETHVIDPNNPQIVVTTTTSTNFDKCSISGSCPSSSSSSCKSSSSCSSSSSCDHNCKSSQNSKKCTCFRFQAMINNTVNLRPSLVEFIMRRTNGTVVVQWQQFSGVINANGVPYITAERSLPSSLPPYSVNHSLPILFNGRGQNGVVEATPDFDQIRFYFNIDKSGANIQQGDSFTIYGGNITWLVN